MQLTTDSLKCYLNAVKNAFGNDIDYAMLIKIYGEIDHREANGATAPLPASVAETKNVKGSPDPDHIQHVAKWSVRISTMRMSMRRFTQTDERLQQEGREPALRWSRCLLHVVQLPDVYTTH